MKEKWFTALFTVLLLAALSSVGYLWWQRQQPPPAPTQQARTAPQDVAQAPAAPPPAEGPRYPVSEEAPPAAEAPATVDAAIADLVDSPAALSMLQLDGFVRRVVATVDNLGRAHAPPRLWPVDPSPGRFTAADTGAGGVIDARNAARYEPFVALVERIDTERALAWYTRLYPQFQQAYEELGYPGRYFNDRLVAVIDLLLATPQPSQPPRVHLVEVQGPVASTRPWVRYEFVDPALESLASGQKVLLRMSEGQARRLKGKLAEVREQLAGTTTAR
ncbi:DUF3014 domain-containing protein [Schlegelella sp. S2-27]|uniref:DUF3014 domain-containing protein n=1 Tax=Caldimonas mangrovi TaxID=2944811 RepID=A0ABT0YP96_9BURK|nr:DUF3014 domain-containing protein [Caldimonas mangrovi]MCM5679981.1 DUF3014 domain-containing protein [Caldimonas mangrovi]